MYCNVLVNKEGVVDENYLFFGEDVAAKAEQKFSELCKKHYPAISDEELEVALEDGWIGTHTMICLSWPDIELVQN